MIIWGSKGKETKLSEGDFFCPKCRSERAYKQKRISKYFTLYFVPLFETKNLGEFVECQICKSGFDLQILDPSYQIMLKLIAGTRKALLHGQPSEKIKTRLVKAGYSSDSAAARSTPGRYPCEFVWVQPANPEAVLIPGPHARRAERCRPRSTAPRG